MAQSLDKMMKQITKIQKMTAGIFIHTKNSIENFKSLAKYSF